MSEQRQCPSCGAGVSAGARFCRGCGAAVEVTQTAAAEGGGEPAVPPEPPPPSRARGPVFALAAFAVCLLVGGAIAGGAYLLSRDDSGGDAVEGPSIPPIGGIPPPDGEGTGIGTTETDAVDDSQGSGGGLSPLAPGRYIQAGSFRSPEGAQREVDRLVGEGIDVEAVPADWADELLPGFQVLLVGPLATSGEERQALQQLEDANVAGFGRDLTPSGELSGPAVAAGSWSGDLEQSYLRGTRSPRTYRVDFTLAPGGESGTVDYPSRGCHASLTLSEESGFSLAYSESIESGSCRPGGVWHLRPEGAAVTAVRLYEDLDVQVMVDGEAVATG